MEDTERLERAQEALGYTFQHPEILYQSLRHPSSTDQRLDSCERMEFLGDAILGMVVVDYCLLYTSPSPRDRLLSRMPSSA